MNGPRPKALATLAMAAAIAGMGAAGLARPNPRPITQREHKRLDPTLSKAVGSLDFGGWRQGTARDTEALVAAQAKRDRRNGKRLSARPAPSTVEAGEPA